MSQQAADLPRFVQIIGRYRSLVGIMALLGLFAGVVFAALNPPVFTSRAFVLYEPPCPAGGICGGPAFLVPGGPARKLTIGAQLKPEAGNILSVSAVGRTAAQAEAAADAAARSLAGAGSLSYQGEQISGLIAEPATTATGTPQQLFGDALLGAVLGALAGILAALAGGRTTIDPLPAPRGLAVGGQEPSVGQGPGIGDPEAEARSGSTGIWLQQLAREHVEQQAARDAALIGTLADSP
jgi:hypothetical protein